jgi:glycerol kinase
MKLRALVSFPFVVLISTLFAASLSRFFMATTETSYKFDKLIIDGGVARNDFILQLIADLTGMCF